MVHSHSHPPSQSQLPTSTPEQWESLPPVPRPPGNGGGQNTGGADEDDAFSGGVGEVDVDGREGAELAEVLPQHG